PLLAAWCAMEQRQDAATTELKITVIGFK
ncbi:MAG: hypothetical protein ACI9JZ_001006, partial [Lentimonas sp.]